MFLPPFQCNSSYLGNRIYAQYTVWSQTCCAAVTWHPNSCSQLPNHLYLPSQGNHVPLSPGLCSTTLCRTPPFSAQFLHWFNFLKCKYSHFSMLNSICHFMPPPQFTCWNLKKNHLHYKCWCYPQLTNHVNNIVIQTVNLRGKQSASALIIGCRPPIQIIAFHCPLTH